MANSSVCLGSVSTESALCLHLFGSKHGIWRAIVSACPLWWYPLRSRTLPESLPRGCSTNFSIPADSSSLRSVQFQFLLEAPAFGPERQWHSCEDAYMCWRFLVRRASQKRSGVCVGVGGHIPDQCPNCHTESPGPTLTALTRQLLQQLHCPEVEGGGRGMMHLPWAATPFVTRKSSGLLREVIFRGECPGQRFGSQRMKIKETPAVDISYLSLGVKIPPPLCSLH